MCGICGFTGLRDDHTLEAMTAALHHRGPDGVGYFKSNDVFFGMRRLAIIDLDTGDQPAFNEDRSIAVVFNGEIYNHVELRRDLERRGHRFRSDHSDTEVIVHLYEEYGVDFLKELNGMFAIALWDSSRRELHLARDRAGVKPLFFAEHGAALVFGSEIKALLRHPAINCEPDLPALAHYFSLKHVPAPASGFKGISQLRAGERGVWRDGKFERERWWRLPMERRCELDEMEATAAVRELLEDSVKLRMRSDVPFGAYLSGGVDSSTVVALMSKMSDAPVRTFSLTYERDYMNKSSDRAFAREVSAMYSTEHHEHVMTAEEVLAAIDDVVYAFDQPFSGVTSTYFLTHLISRHVKVALSGDGADELFGSYLAHRIATPLARLTSLGGADAELDENARCSLAPFDDNLDFLRDVWRAGDDEAGRRMALYLHDDDQQRALFTDAMRSAGLESTQKTIGSVYDAAPSDDPLNRSLFVDFETLLPDQVLAFVDRLSMAHSVEVRAPFMDYRLMELAASLPGAYKIKRGRVKHILKQAVADLLPSGVVDRPKEGFLLPINDWISEKFADVIRESLAPARINKHGLLHGETVTNLLNEHYGGRTQHGPRLWNLAMFQLWWERYFV